MTAVRYETLKVVIASFLEAEHVDRIRQTHLGDLPELAPKVRWIQSTSSSIGPFVEGMGYAERMPDTLFTRASGVHAQPLAEFCVMVMLLFRKGLHRMMRDQQRKHWERYAATDLAGRTLVVVGVGAVGSEIARIAKDSSSIPTRCGAGCVRRGATARGQSVMGHAQRSPEPSFREHKRSREPQARGEVHQAIGAGRDLVDDLLLLLS